MPQAPNVACTQPPPIPKPKASYFERARLAPTVPKPKASTTKDARLAPVATPKASYFERGRGAAGRSVHDTYVRPAAPTPPLKRAVGHEEGFTLVEVMVALAVWTLFFGTATFALHQIAHVTARSVAGVTSSSQLEELASRLRNEAGSAFAINVPNAREVDFATETGGQSGSPSQYWAYRWDGRAVLTRLDSTHPLRENLGVNEQPVADDVTAFDVRDLAPGALGDPFLRPQTLAARDARIPLRDATSIGGDHVVEVTLATAAAVTQVDLMPMTLPTGVAVRADYVCQARCRLNDCYALPTINPFINCKMFAGKSLNACAWHVSWSFFLGFEAVYQYTGRDSVTAAVPFALGGPAYASFCDNVSRQGLWYDNG